MDSTNTVIVTSTNYFQCKSHMKDLLGSKGHFRITLGTKTSPTTDEKKVKWYRKMI